MEIEGIACLEAISCGLIPLISDSERSATRDFAVDGRCLFRNKNSKDLAEKIDFWIENPEVKKEYEKRYLSFANNFSLLSSMKQMRDMLSEYSLIRGDSM